MLLKRIYTKPEGWGKQVDENGKCINPPPLDYISLANTGINPEQNFSTDLVTEGLTSGRMKIDGETLIMDTYPEPLRYTIKRRPGRYCLHCGEKLADDQTGALARLHVAEKHAGEPSPDKNVPAGYISINHFECVLNAEQHEKYRVKPEHKHRAPVFHLRDADGEKH
jgi:hypothetical protein